MNGSIPCGNRRRPGSRAGAMVVLVAVVMVILMVSAAFSVDIAYMYLANEQLHVASDAAAKAAVTSLSLGHTQATALADGVTCAAANKVCGASVTLVGSRDITLGSVTYSTSNTWTFVPSGTPTTAAKVSATAAIPTFFGTYLGVTTFSTTRSATAAFVRNKICLVIDRSGSMGFDFSGNDWSYPADKAPSPWNKVSAYPSNLYGYYNYNTPPDPNGSRWSGITSAVTSFLNIIATSPVTTQVAMVSFGDNATNDATFSTTYTPITSAMTSYGSAPIQQGTNFGAGLLSAINLFSSTDDGTPWNKIIIVFSDGDWNEGTDPHTYIPNCVSAGIVVHCVALLNNGGNTTMSDVAAGTGGNYYYVASQAALTAAFTTLANQIPVILTQ